MEHNVEDDLRQAEKIAKELKSISEYQREGTKYYNSLKTCGPLTRLEILSGALEDLIRIDQEYLIDIFNNGTVLEKMYSSLILCRNGYLKSNLLIDSNIFDEYDHGYIWKMACEYAVNERLSTILSILNVIFNRNIAETQLAINLVLTIANAPHRIVINQIFTVAVESDVLDEWLNHELKKSKNHLRIRDSLAAVRQYKFKIEELKNILS